MIFGAKSVLFVCIGNSCRSPAAEAIFRDLSKDRYLVSSAGICPVKVDQHMILTLRERGFTVPLSFKSSHIDEETKEFDLVVCLDSSVSLLRSVIDWQEHQTERGHKRGIIIVFDVVDPHVRAEMLSDDQCKAYHRLIDALDYVARCLLAGDSRA